MVQLTTEQRVFIVLHYTQNQNTTAVKNAFRARFLDNCADFKSSQILGVKRLFYRKTSEY